MSDARDRDGLYSMMTAGVVRWVPVLQVGAAEPSNPMDAVATEEPLQVQVGGQPFAVIMRTPGADRELTIGFLLAERVIPAPRTFRTSGARPGSLTCLMSPSRTRRRRASRISIARGAR